MNSIQAQPRLARTAAGAVPPIRGERKTRQARRGRRASPSLFLNLEGKKPKFRNNSKTSPTILLAHLLVLSTSLLRLGALRSCSLLPAATRMSQVLGDG
mmetsp:Transcript_86537/g.231163  ORF Transcript_86537/g.231163 Transcript_86537/m.231163 type:complete len:99 (+) Transcript_86537:56-352(+)